MDESYLRHESADEVITLLFILGRKVQRGALKSKADVEDELRFTVDCYKFGASEHLTDRNQHPKWHAANAVLRGLDHLWSNFLDPNR